MREPRTVTEQARDVDLVEQMLARIATPDEAAAARRVLGIQREADRLTLAHSPKRPPLSPVGQNVDHLKVARDALDRYTAWRDSHPDDDPTPLRERERTVRQAVWAVKRLENR